MRVSFNWLKTLVEIPVSPYELAERMTLSGVAVENIEDPGKDISNVVAARIEKIDRHPDADKLVVCTVEAGQGMSLQIVTGAPNVYEGQIVALALVGATLPGGIKISKSKLRGMESYGMLCSGQELGIDVKNLPEDQQYGILDLSGETVPGQDIKPLLGLDDTILELELTPNRSDCLSMIGVAREVAAVLGTDLHLPEIRVEESSETIDGRVTVKIADPALCRRYAARLIKNVKIGPSPLWMRLRLQAAGIRPINNVVDVTNYVLMELGQPLHAFDADKLSSGEINILVRTAKPGEKMNSLDGVERELDDGMLVITDGENPAAIAGVMGGLESEVTDDTRTILLESANFAGSGIRRTSKKLALRSESSIRFEKGVDINICIPAIQRAAQLIREMGAGEVVKGIEDNYPAPIEGKVIVLRPDRVAQILGVEVPREEIARVLQTLRFPYLEKGTDFEVSVPTARGDITIEIDLIEEVARLFGYNRIPTTLPSGAAVQGGRSGDRYLAGLTREIMLNCGLTEVITMSFINPRAYDAILLPGDSPLRDSVVVQNPLSEDQRVLRTTLIPGVLETLSRNAARRNKDAAVFEIGHAFYPVAGQELPIEELTLAGAMTGSLPGGWNNRAEGMDFFYAKGVIETLLAAFDIRDAEFIPVNDNPILHPGRAAEIRVKGAVLGFVGEISPRVQENYRLTERVYVFRVNLSALFPLVNLVKKYRQLPKYPAVDRDMALLVRQETAAGELLRVIAEAGGELLKEVKLFDLYQGERLPAGHKSLAYSLRFQAPDRTLTDEEVNAVFDKICASLKDKVGAELRS
jgi:phenylalanyl-tRNA synthetase beta chain